MAKKNLEYVLITPAHNEEAFIENIIQSVISQTLLPKTWVIVNDGSTDKTDEIIQRYLTKHRWIKYINLPKHKDRQFAAKVYAFQAGYDEVKENEFDIIGNLDADITFDRTYFEYIIDQFNKIDNLGVAGTAFIEGENEAYNYTYTNIHHVSGQCQMFRRECYIDIGGYQPVREGGIDWIAVTTARMKGWRTQTFTEKKFIHHRKMGTGRMNNELIARFNYGKKDYYTGGHPLWELFRIIYQMSEKPYIIGGLILAMGYVYQSVFHHKRPISKELVKFNQKEQMERLKKFVTRKNRKT